MKEHHWDYRNSTAGFYELVIKDVETGCYGINKRFYMSKDQYLKLKKWRTNL